ncbi:AraC family transcriptional regulator [Myxococcus sp. RHSTA-1-4]|uniref:helix-turn-helix transcriptional regulator n=1 Tax=Myxococcus sp. RHSTA-1-4 TaxID=2874601 RepID=UPI001CBADB17
MSRIPTWKGRLFFGSLRLMYVGPLGETRPHAHHSFQILLSLGEPVALRDRGQRVVTCHASVIPPDVEHTVVGGAGSVVLLHVNPDDLVGRRLRTLGIGAEADAWRYAGEPLRTCAVQSPPRRWAESEALAQALLQALQADTGAPPPSHPAIKKLLRLLPEVLEEDVRLSALAPRVGLSAGRLSHLFGAEVGLPLRPYVLWLRLQRAAGDLRKGATLTQAAHAAGFTDSAHLSHAFRRTFGITPSEIAGVVDWVLPPPE